MGCSGSPLSSLQKSTLHGCPRWPTAWSRTAVSGFFKTAGERERWKRSVFKGLEKAFVGENPRNLSWSRVPPTVSEQKTRYALSTRLPAKARFLSMSSLVMRTISQPALRTLSISPLGRNVVLIEGRRHSISAKPVSGQSPDCRLFTRNPAQLTTANKASIVQARGNRSCEIGGYSASQIRDSRSDLALISPL